MVPTSGFHSTIDRPEWVSRVTPPTITMAKTSVQQSSSHVATCLRELWSGVIDPQARLRTGDARCILPPALEFHISLDVQPLRRPLPVNPRDDDVHVPGKVGRDALGVAALGPEVEFPAQETRELAHEGTRLVALQRRPLAFGQFREALQQAQVGVDSGANRSTRVERICPSLTKVGPMSSRARRARSADVIWSTA